MSSENDSQAFRLLAACYAEDVETVRNLLEQGADVNARDENHCVLYIAAKCGCDEVVKMLLQHGANVDATNDDRHLSALTVACIYKRLSTAQSLLEYGANVNILDTFGQSALFIASQHGSTKVVELLLQHGAYVNVQDKRGRSVLMVAIEYNFIDIVRLLLWRGANMMLKDADGWSALTIGSHYGYTELVCLLLRRGADVNDAVDERSALFIACQNNKAATVLVLLKYGANVNQQVKGWSALMIACKNGHSKLVKILLEQNADVNLCNSGWTALMIASQQGDTAIVRELLTYGAYMYMRGLDSLTALMIASQNGHAKTAELLLIREAYRTAELPLIRRDEYYYVNLKNSEGKTALIFASEKGYAKTIKVLLEYGANVNNQDNIFSISALMYACSRGHSKSVKILLKHGADVNMQDKNGESALIIASFNGHIETVKILLNYGADINIQGCDGSSALFYAYQKGHNEVATLLLRYGASLDYQRNFDGQTILMSAIQRKDNRTVKLLLNIGVNVDIQDNGGQTALIIATKYRDTKTAKLLLKSGANINIQNIHGYTALMIASENGCVEIVDILLLSHKADLSMQEKDGWTALMFACQHGYILTASMLIEYGADVNQTKNDGWTALTLARINHHTHTTELLIKNGAMDADPKKKCFHHTYTSTCTLSVTGTEDSGYGPSAEQHALSHKEASSENSTVVSVTTSEQYFSWEGYGLHLYIPEGALPLEIEACAISIEASVEGNYKFLENSHPVSAVYWFHCFPKCKFLRPITLEIQHCAKQYKQQNLQALSFVKATTKSTKDQSEVNFNRAHGCCGTNRGVFPSQSSYGFIQLDSFCGYGVVQEGSDNRQYRANMYYLPQSVSHCEIHFTVLWNTDAHHTIIKNHYLRQNAEDGPDKLIEFDSESVRLDIPKKGIATEDDMWRIFPLVFPAEVTKKEVDSFDVGKRIPACRLQAIAHNSQHHDVTSLIHPLKLLGTKTLHDYITLFRHSSVNTSELGSTKLSGNKKAVSDSDDDDDDYMYYSFVPNQGPYHPNQLKDSLRSQHTGSATSSTTISKYQLGAHESVAATPTEYSTMVAPPPVPPRTFKDKVKSEAQTLSQTSSYIETSVKPLQDDPLQATFQTFGLVQQTQVYPDQPLQYLPHSVTAATVNFPLNTQQYLEPPEKSKEESPQDLSHHEAFQERTTVTSQHSHSAGVPSASKPETQEGDLQSLPATVVQHHSTQIHQFKESVTAAFQHSLTGPQTRVYPEPPRFTTLLNELTNRVAAKWEEIGYYLQLESGLLEIIKKDNPSDCRACLREMLKEWMKQVDPPPSWSAIIKAVKDCGYRPLARTLREKYLPDTIKATLN